MRGRSGWRQTALLAAVAVMLSCNGPPAPDGEGLAVLVGPYAGQGVWLKANFHAHSTHSHGRLRPGDLVDLYQQHGYTALCISDHNQYGDQDGGVLSGFYQRDSLLHDWNGDGVLHPDSIGGSGSEAYVRDFSREPPAWQRDRWYQPAAAQHVTAPIVVSGYEASNAIFGAHFVLVGYPPGPVAPPRPGFDWLEPLHAAGGVAIIAHPGGANHDVARFVAAVPVRDFDALEIVNGARLTRGEIADATPLWDALLRRGQSLWGIANDDAHKLPGDDELYPFVAFDMVQCAAPTQAALLAALHAGSFYASTGLFFEDLHAEGPRLHVYVPGARRLRFVTGDSTATTAVAGPAATWTAGGSEVYVRVEATGDSCRGPRASWLLGAWSQPFRVVPPSEVRRR